MKVNNCYPIPILKRFCIFYFLIQTSIIASELDAWILALSSDDDRAQAEARQLLPREGIEAVPPLLSLLADERQRVWRTAFAVLADICNEVSKPGREHDRCIVTSYLMKFLSETEDPHLIELGLRLIPIVLPENFDVTPIARLLEHPILRDKARAALEESGTAPACKALRDALLQSDEDFQCALLNSLAALKDREVLTYLEQFALYSPPRVRTAAMYCLAWTGESQYAHLILTLFEKRDESTFHSALDALLYYLENLFERGGNWELGMALTRWLFAKPEIQAKCAALQMLGRFGDEVAAKEISQVLLAANDKNLVNAALTACRTMTSLAAYKVFRDTYYLASSDLQLLLLDVFGTTRHPIFLDILAEATQSQDSAKRELALDALVSSELPGALPIVIAYAKNVDETGRVTAENRLKTLTQALEKRGFKKEVSPAYVTLYQLATTEENKHLYLEKIKENPTVEAFDILLASMTPTELYDLPPSVLLGLASTLREMGREADATPLIEHAFEHITSPQLVMETVQLIDKSPFAEEWGARLGFIKNWWIVGPFPWNPQESFQRNFINEPEVNLQETYSIKDKSITWLEYHVPGSFGLVDLTQPFGMESNSVAFALTQIEVCDSTEAILKVGSDDGVKIWVNRKVVHENDVDRGSAIDQDSIPIQLQAGVNTILLEVTQRGGGWNFIVRLTDPQGRPLRFTNILNRNTQEN